MHHRELAITVHQETRLLTLAACMWRQNSVVVLCVAS
jgi:hypothetical protein